MVQVAKNRFLSRYQHKATVRAPVTVPLQQPRRAPRLREMLTAGARRPLAVLRHAVRVPAEVVFGRGERVLATGYAPDGTVVLVATDVALHHRAGGAGWSQLGWERIGAIAWDDVTGRIAISGVTGAGAPCTILKLRERGVLPELAAERIAHTRLGCRQTTLDGHGRLFVEVRRRPRTGELMWVLVSDGGFGCGGTGGAGPCGCSPGVREQIDVLVADFQDELGVIGPVGPVIRPPQR